MGCKFAYQSNKYTSHLVLFVFDYEEKTANKSRSTLALHIDVYHVDNNVSVLADLSR